MRGSADAECKAEDAQQKRACERELRLVLRRAHRVAQRADHGAEKRCGARLSERRIHAAPRAECHDGNADAVREERAAQRRRRSCAIARRCCRTPHRIDHTERHLRPLVQGPRHGAHTERNKCPTVCDDEGEQRNRDGAGDEAFCPAHQVEL